MLKLVFFGIIILIIIREIYESHNSKPTVIDKNILPNSVLNIQSEKKVKIVSPLKNDDIVEYDAFKPWSRVVYISNSDYPYNYYIKLKIPSLNDYESWKSIIPNLNFDPRTGELIIPSKDEASALALANLISINFLGQLSLDNILEKNLIQISISKAKSHEVVRNKLREQIIENLQGAKINISDISFEKDLVNINKQENDVNISIEAYNGNDYAYL